MDGYFCRDRYFDPTETGFSTKPVLRQVIRFRTANLMNGEAFQNHMPFEIIFCRNLLIYLTDTARQHVVRNLEKLLASDGVLFVGHAEQPFLKGPDWIPIHQNSVFAFRKASKNRPEFPEFPKFERRARAAVNPDAPTAYAGQDRRKAPDELTQLINRARQSADQASFDEALRLCDRILTLDKINVQAYFLKGLICQAQNQLTQAETWYNRILYLQPEHCESLNYLKLIAEHQGEFQKAKNIQQRMDRIQRQVKGIC